MNPLKINGNNSISEAEKLEERPVWPVKSGGEIQKFYLAQHSNALINHPGVIVNIVEVHL